MSKYTIHWYSRFKNFKKPSLSSAYDPSKLYSIKIDNTKPIGIRIDTKNKNTYPLISNSTNTKIKLGDQIVSINDISMFNLKVAKIKSIFKSMKQPFICTFINNKPLRGGHFKSRSTKQKYSRVTRKK